MAIDTRDKRASLMAAGIDAHIVLPTPGTHTQGDRQQVAGSYRGILAIQLILTSLVTLTVRARSFVLTCKERAGIAMR